MAIGRQRLIYNPLLQQTTFPPALKKSTSCYGKRPLTGGGDNRMDECLNSTELKCSLVCVDTE